MLGNVLKYHFDLRYIYDYTIKVTKIHVLGLIESHEIFKNLFQLNKDKLKGRKLNDHEKQAKANQGALHIIKIVGTYAEEKSSSKLIYRPDTLSFSKYQQEHLIECNTNLFGGCSYTYNNRVSDSFSSDIVPDVTLQDIIDCYKKSDNRDLGF